MSLISLPSFIHSLARSPLRRSCGGRLETKRHFAFIRRPPSLARRQCPRVCSPVRRPSFCRRRPFAEVEVGVMRISYCGGDRQQSRIQCSSSSSRRQESSTPFHWRLVSSHLSACAVCLVRDVKRHSHLGHQVVRCSSTQMRTALLPSLLCCLL